MKTLRSRALLCLIGSGLIASGLLASAAWANTIVVEEIIVKVNGDVVLRSEYENILTDMRAELERDTRIPEEQRPAEFANREKNALRDLVDERLLVQKGKEMGVNVESQILRQREELMARYELKTVDEFEQWAVERAGMAAEDLMDRMRDNFLSQSVLGQEVGSRIVIRREEIENYYNEHKDEFVRSEGVRLSEILIATEGLTGEALDEAEKEARDVLSRVQRGELFDEMARRFSDSEASKEAGGDIGIFRRGSLVKDIEDLVFDKNPGYITELIDVARGKLILKVTERYREGLAELEEVQDEIRNRLIAPRYSPAIREYLSSLREDAYIEIRPGYVDSGAIEGQDTSWTDPARLAPVTTTREEVLAGPRQKKLLWMVPLGGDGKDKDQQDETSSEIGGGLTQ